MRNNEYRSLTPLFDELHGERVIVRPYHEEDAQALQEAVAESREHIRPWLPFADDHKTVERARDFMLHAMAKWLTREDLYLSVWDKETQRFLGGTGLHPRNWEIGFFEIGYWLRASATGKGYMTEAVHLITDYAFEHLDANRVLIRCDERNASSAAIPRRLGFVQEALLRNDSLTTDGTLRNTLVFSMIPTDRKNK